MTHTKQENPVGAIFKEIKLIQRLNHDASKPMDNQILQNEALKAKEIYKRESFTKQALEKTTALKEKLQGKEIEKWLLAILEPSQTSSTLSAIQESSQIYGDYFKEDVYRQLLPYTQIAYAYEQNGSAEEHALKLSVLFKDFNSALEYLNKNIERSSLHDACLFVIPDTSRCTFPIWQTLAQQNSNEELFRKLLGQACEIESLIKADCEEATKSKSKPNWKEIIALKKSIEKNHTKWKELKTNALKRDKASEEFTRLSNQLLHDRNKLTHLRAGISLDENMDLLTLSCYQERYIQEASSAYQYMLSKGLTQKDYEKFLKLDRTRAGENIPDFTIDGKDLGFPGFYLKKCNVQVEEEAARAACLGKLTNCCQSLSGETGEPCTIHGLTSPNGGFYILCKGDISNPKISDPVIAQSWAWRSTTNAIVFDSIEENSSNSKSTSKMAIDFYRHLGKSLCLSNDTNKVSCGASSGISPYLGTEIISNPEIKKDYQGYSDSTKQRYVFDKNRPWYLFNKDEDAKNLTSLILMVALTSPSPLEESKPLFEMLNWALNDELRPKPYWASEKSDSGITILNFITATLEKHERKDEFHTLVKNIREFLNPPINLETVVKYENKEFYSNAINYSGQTLLMRAAHEEQFNLFERLIKKVAPISAKEISAKDWNEDTLLNYIVNKPQFLKLLLESLPEQERLQNLQTENKRREQIIELALKTPDSFEIIFSLIPPTYHLQALQNKNYQGFTLMHFVIISPEALSIILKIVSIDKVLQALHGKDDLFGKTSLYYAVENHSSLKTILDILPENDWSSALQATDNKDKTLLDYAREKGNEKSLDYITNNPNYHKYLKAIQQKPIATAATENIDVQQVILNEIESIIEGLNPTQGSLNTNPHKSKIKALNDLCDLITNKENCWTEKNIKHDSYNDLFTYWAKQKQFKNPAYEQLTNLEMVDLNNTVSSTIFSPLAFGTPSGEAVKALMKNYKEVPLGKEAHDEVRRLSI